MALQATVLRVNNLKKNLKCRLEIHCFLMALARSQLEKYVSLIHSMLLFIMHGQLNLTYVYTILHMYLESRKSFLSRSILSHYCNTFLEPCTLCTFSHVFYQH